MALACVLSAAGKSGGASATFLLRNSPTSVVGVAHFMTATGGEPLPRYGPKPFPYTEKKFTPFHALIESPTRRFNENSKIIVVEGNIGTGKADFVKRLAKEFDLHAMAPVSLDDIFSFPQYDYDLREMDSYLPQNASYYDLKQFYQEKDKSDGRAALLQASFFFMRWFQYSEAMLHLISTGSGVVLPRSCYSDAVYCDTLLELGYIKQQGYNYITKVRANAICDLWKPHLTIYIDTPVEQLLENIKKRARPEEMNSPILNEQYLRLIEKKYKEKLLPEMRKSGEVLVYDHSEVDDWEAIVDDIERLQLDPVPEDEVKFADWNKHREDEFNEFRMLHQNKKRMYREYFRREPPFDSPEMLLSIDACNKWMDLEQTHPMHRYAPGWNPDFGDNYWKMVFSLFSSKKQVGSDERPGYLFRSYHSIK